MLAWASAPWVGIRSNTERRSCSPLVITLTSLVDSPASYRASSRPSRSCMASLSGALRLGLRLRHVEVGEGPPGQVGAGRVPVRRQVVELVVVAGDADVGGAGRAQRRPVGHVPVGDVIDSSHAATLRDLHGPVVDPCLRCSGNDTASESRGTSSYAYGRVSGVTTDFTPDRAALRELAARLPRARRDLGLQLPVHQGRRGGAAPAAPHPLPGRHRCGDPAGGARRAARPAAPRAPGVGASLRGRRARRRASRSPSSVTASSGSSRCSPASGTRPPR